jgi:hypothetical protein
LTIDSEITLYLLQIINYQLSIINYQLGIPMPLDSTTAITFLGVQVWDEGTEEHFVRIGNSTAIRTMLCAWEDRVAIIDQIRGGGAETGAFYFYTPSQVYPDAPWLPFDSIHVEGLPGEDGLVVGPNGLAGYKYARLRIVYKSLDYFEGVTTGTMSLDFATQVVGLPASTPTYQFPDGTPLSPQDTPPIRVGIVTIVQTRKNLALLPTSLVQSLAGCVNSVTFLGGSPGTVLFDGAHADRRLTTIGAENWDMTYKFLYLPAGWNNVLQPSSKVSGSVAIGTFQQVARIGTGATLYPTADLTPLLD